MNAPALQNAPPASAPSAWTRWLAFGCGFLAFGGICVVGLSLRMLVAQADPAANAVSGFLEDIRGDDYTSALRRMNATYQRDFDTARLEREVRALPGLEAHLTSVLTAAESQDALDGHARATVEGALYGSEGEIPVAFELSEDAGYWYIDLVVVDGRPLP